MGMAAKTIKIVALAVVLTINAVADAATVDAGTLTTVSVNAPLYDDRSSADGGCNLDGCSGDLTRVSK